MPSDDERPRSSYSAETPMVPAGDPVDPVLPEVRLDERIRRIADEIATAGELTGDEAYAMIHNAITGPAPLQRRIDELTVELADTRGLLREMDMRIALACLYADGELDHRDLLGEPHEHELGVECWPCNVRRILVAGADLVDPAEVNQRPGDLAHLKPTRAIIPPDVPVPALNVIAGSAQAAFGHPVSGTTGRPFLLFSTRYNYAHGLVEDLRCAGYKIVPVGDGHAPG